MDAQEAALEAGEAEVSESDEESASVSGSEEGEQKQKVKGGFGVCALSPALAALLGEEWMGRTEVVKALWVYIKGRNLQNPKDRRKIIIDEGLGTVFKHPLTMFNMNKQLSRHLHYRDAMQAHADAQPDPKPKKRKAAAGGAKGSGKKAKNGKDGKKGKKKSGGGGALGKLWSRSPLPA